MFFCMKNRIFILLVVVFAANGIFAQNIIDMAALFMQQPDTVNEKKLTFLEQLALPDSATNATVVVHQSPILDAKINSRNINEGQTIKGFRIQLYSSNTPRTAKQTAFDIETEVKEKLPEVEIYVSYHSPFWKVRVGNCLSHQEATELLLKLRKEFPEYRTEMYIVPDQVVIQ